MVVQRAKGFSVSIELACPACHQATRVPEAALGKKGRCPACKHVFLLERPVAKRRAEPASQTRSAAPQPKLVPLASPVLAAAPALTPLGYSSESFASNGLTPLNPPAAGMQALQPLSGAVPSNWDNDSFGLAPLPVAPMDQWYCYLPDGQQMGPGTQQQLMESISHGQLSPATLVRRSDWPHAIPAANAFQLNSSGRKETDMWGDHGTPLDQLKSNPLGVMLTGYKMAPVKGDYSENTKAARTQHLRIWQYTWLGIVALNACAGMVGGLIGNGILGAFVGLLSAIVFVFIGSLPFGLGLWVYCGALFEWQFFFNSRRARGVRLLLGDKGARMFYLGMGMVFMVPSLLVGLVCVPIVFGTAASGQASTSQSGPAWQNQQQPSGSATATNSGPQLPQQNAVAPQQIASAPVTPGIDLQSAYGSELRQLDAQRHNVDIIAADIRNLLNSNGKVPNQLMLHYSESLVKWKAQLDKTQQAAIAAGQSIPSDKAELNETSLIDPRRLNSGLGNRPF